MKQANFRDTYLLPALRGWLCGTLQSARQSGITECYSFPLGDLSGHFEQWFNVGPAEAKRLATRELSRGLCVRGWRFALSSYYQNGQRLVVGQRLHS